MRLLVLLCVFCMVSAQAQPPSSSLTSKINAVENSLAPATIYGDTLPHWNLKERMKIHHVKGLSIAVIDNYKIVWAKGYGWADEEAGKPVTEHTRFQAASISKSLNSLGVLKLVQRGLLVPDADINTYLKSWKFPYDSLSGGKKINVYDLLSHTAGTSVHGFWGYGSAGPFPTVKQVLNGESPANSKAVRSMFPPGQKFQYSGGGTTVTQLMVSDITGQDYAAYMKKEVLDPLGMKESFFTQPPPPGTKDLAVAYVNGQHADGDYHVYPEQAAAGLWTTPADIARYVIETQLAFEGRSAKVLNRQMTQQRFTPRIDSAFGLGLFIENRNGHKYFNHNGGNYGFVCTYYGSLKGGKGVVIMTNGEQFQMINELLNSVAQVYKWPGFYEPKFVSPYKMNKDTLTAYLGSYKLESDTLTMVRCGEELCMRQSGQVQAMKMVFTSATSFTLPDVPGAVISMLYKEGKVYAMEIRQGGQTLTALRMD